VADRWVTRFSGTQSVLGCTTPSRAEAWKSRMELTERFREDLM